MDFEPFLTGRFWAFWTVSTIIWTVFGSITDCLPKDMKTTTPYAHHLHESPATYSLATNPQVSRPSAGVFRLTVLHEGEYLIAPISEGWKHVDEYRQQFLNGSGYIKRISGNCGFLKRKYIYYGADETTCLSFSSLVIFAIKRRSLTHSSNKCIEP